MEKQCGMVDDEAALEWLRLEHQRRGHVHMELIKTMYKNGSFPNAPRLAERQLDLQLHCPICDRTRQKRKKSAKRLSKRKKVKELRLLEEVFVDPVGPRRVPSLRYIGERGNQAGGCSCVVC